MPPTTTSERLAHLVRQKGGAWLTVSHSPVATFTPERLTSEHRQIARTVDEFVDREVQPVLHRLEQRDWTLARALMKQAASLGLCGADVSVLDGGIGLNRIAAIVVSDRMARAGSFSATFGAHTNLAVLALALFGSESQKQHYLRRLLTGEMIGAYCLSEHGSGSDAFSAKTRTRPLPEGGFAIDGEKAWTTNGGIADMFVVFARVDDGSPRGQFSAFILDRDAPGLSIGAEEEKMGLLGSSTTTVVMKSVSVDVRSDVRTSASVDARASNGQLLGIPGAGRHIALTVLNFARLRLGASCVGGARDALAEAARYAASRRQFGRPIASFGAIAQKLGAMTARIYAAESLVYRTAGLIAAYEGDERSDERPTDPSGGREGDREARAAAAFEEFAMEASIAKVAASETLDFVLDENIQIHGANGFVRGHAPERRYRDARAYRIFEGTNEINRLVIATQLLRRLRTDAAPVPAGRSVFELPQDEPEVSATHVDASLTPAFTAIGRCKVACLGLTRLVREVCGDRALEEQEILLSLANVLIDTYAAESAVLRAAAAPGALRELHELHGAAARVFAEDAACRVRADCRRTLAALLQGDRLAMEARGVDRLFDAVPADTVRLGRQLADAVVERSAYPFPFQTAG